MSLLICEEEDASLTPCNDTTCTPLLCSLAEMRSLLSASPDPVSQLMYSVGPVEQLKKSCSEEMRKISVSR